MLSALLKLNDPILGATVRLKKDASKGANTDINGEFTLQAKQGDILVISYIGYKAQEVKAAAHLTIKLLPDAELLDEVVVVGYTTRSVANTSASVVKVSAKDLADRPTANVLEAAQGKVSGLQVYTSSGEPSATSSMKLHGVGSLGASSAPLYILDGMPVSSAFIRSMNPNDFESMQFLKDAAATSIYGARAANGVVYIQTKRGVINERATIKVRGQYGISTLANTAYFNQLMNTQELLSFWKEIGAKSQSELDGFTKNFGMNDVQWYKYLYQDAPMYQSDLSISGGSGHTTYYISGGLFSKDGLRAGSDYKKLNLRSNINSRLNDVIRVGLNTSVSYDRSHLNPYGGTYSDGGGLAVYTAPFFTPYDKNGKEYYDIKIPGKNSWAPKKYVDTTPRNNANLFLSLAGNTTITPFENFQIRSQAAIEVNDYTYDTTNKLSLPSRSVGSRLRKYSRTHTFSTNNVAEYKFNIADVNHFSALAGQEYVAYTYEGFDASGKGISDDRLSLLGHTTKDKKVGEWFSQYAFLSFFGQFSYDYSEKYFVDLVLRNDASSRFGKNKQNGIFWSAGLLWKAKKENFLASVDWLSDLDVKFSVGTQGNAGIGNYEALATAGKSGQYKGQAGWALGNPGNANLSWENQRKMTLGFTVGLFDRLHVNLEIYDRLTTDMLMDVPQPYTTGLTLDDYGFASIKSNVGAYQNRGIDLSIRGDILRGRDHGLSAYANINYNQDKVLELFQGRDYWALPGYGYGYAVGRPVSFVQAIYKGLNRDNGLPVWYLPTINKDGSIDPKATQMDDSKTTSKYSPALEQLTNIPLYAPVSGGFGVSGNWKGLFAQADFAFVLGKHMISNDMFFLCNPFVFAENSWNLSKDAKNYWKQPGDNAKYPSLDYQRKQGRTLEFDSRMIQDASFLRLKNLTIGYELQNSLLQKQNIVKGAKLYVTARNLLTITKYEGPDPEVDSNLSMGTNPNTKEFLAGIELTF